MTLVRLLVLWLRSTDPYLRGNFNEDATIDFGVCTYELEGDCDCDGNVLDECGVCVAVTESMKTTACCDCNSMHSVNADLLLWCLRTDDDADGICDDVDTAWVTDDVSRVESATVRETSTMRVL